MTGTDVAPPGRRVRTPLRLLVAANAVSASGNVVLTVAVPWLVLSRTGSAALAGLVVCAGVVGATVGGLAAGRVVDAVGPVRTSVLSDFLSAAAVVPLPVLLAVDALEVWHVVALAVLGTVGDAAGAAARQGLVPVAADAEGMPREPANALLTSAEHVGYLVGAPVAGVLVSAVGVGATLWVTVAAFAVAAGVVGGLVRVPAARRSGPGAPPPVGLSSAIAYIWRDPALRALVVFPTSAVLLVAPLTPVVLPVLAREAFASPVALGSMVASYGLGGLLGAAGFGAVGGRVPRSRLYRAVFVVWPSTYAVIALLPVLPVVLAMLLALGTAAGSLVPLQATVRQERSPAHLLPRVVALSTATVPVVGPLGAVLSGLVIDAVGLHPTLLLMTAGAVLVGAAVLRSPGVDDLDRPTVWGPPTSACTIESGLQRAERP